MFDNFVQTDPEKSRDVRNALNSSRQRLQNSLLLMI